MQKSMISLIAILISFASAEGLTQEALTTVKQRFSYAVGVQVGQNISAQAADIDNDALLLGISDILKQQGLKLTVQEMQAAVTNYQNQEMERLMALGKKNLEEGTKFLAENKTKKEITELASGLQYQVLTVGTGNQPKVTDTVVVHYRGSLINGTEFDSSYSRGEPLPVQLDNVIQGWKEVVPLMKVGSKWKVFIPPALAYGDQAAGPIIGPNSTLVFDIELLSITQ